MGDARAGEGIWMKIKGDKESAASDGDSTQFPGFYGCMIYTVQFDVMGFISSMARC